MHMHFLVTVGGGGGGESVFGEPHLAFIFPPILLCETSQGSEFHWIKTAKRKETMIGQAEMDGAPHKQETKVLVHGTLHTHNIV